MSTPDDEYLSLCPHLAGLNLWDMLATESQLVPAVMAAACLECTPVLQTIVGEYFNARDADPSNVTHPCDNCTVATPWPDITTQWWRWGPRATTLLMTCSDCTAGMTLRAVTS